jgi:predicted membrane protein
MPGRVVLRVLLRVTLVLAALGAIGAAVSRRRNVGGAESDEFSIAAIFGGVERVSRATALREGVVLACCGGVQLDLRKAAMAPGGADLFLQACLGGIQVVVPEEWRVVVESDAKAGGVDVRVTPEVELVADAPSLRVEARALLGGIQVTTEPDDDDDTHA